MATDVTDVRTGPETAVVVDAAGDEIRARNAVRAVAAAVGFGGDGRDDLGLVATELATNLRAYAPGGTLTVRPIETDAERGVRLTSTDSGPGIPDVDAAFGVGESTGDSLGFGLSLVNQLMDTVEVTSGDGGSGTRLVADRWLKPPYATSGTCPLGVGAATRPMRRGQPNGDTFVVKRWDGKALVGVVDGLGHGPAAKDAAVRARNYVESHFDRPLQSIFAGTERACKGTRGVVMCLVRLDCTDGTATVANVGNVTARAAGLERDGFALRRGVVGGNAPAPVVVTEAWHSRGAILLHSDGVSARWHWDEVSDRMPQSASATANWLLGAYGAPDDDATVLVVTGRDWK